VSHLVQTHGFNVNSQRPSDGSTPLHLAASFKQKDMLSLLIGLGSDPTIENHVNENCVEIILARERAQNMIWLDLELTDLEDPEVLECTVIITDKDLNEVRRVKEGEGG
jgi:ankyrin repeat protein